MREIMEVPFLQEIYIKQLASKQNVPSSQLQTFNESLNLPHLNVSIGSIIASGTCCWGAHSSLYVLRSTDYL